MRVSNKPRFIRWIRRFKEKISFPLAIISILVRFQWSKIRARDQWRSRLSSRYGARVWYEQETNIGECQRGTERKRELLDLEWIIPLKKAFLELCGGTFANRLRDTCLEKFPGKCRLISGHDWSRFCIRCHVMCCHWYENIWLLDSLFESRRGQTIHT